MTTNQYPVVLTVDGTEASNEAIVDANVSAVNSMFAALLNAEEIAPNALRAYFVDFYLTQALDGGFAQYVFMSPDRAELDTYIRDGLEGMGAAKHLELFNRTAELFDSLSDDDAQAYLDGDPEEVDVVRSGGVKSMDLLDGEFDDLLDTEDLTALGAAWLRSQEGLLLLDGEGLALHIAGLVELIPNLAERQAEAEEAELADAPEFETIIRELCEVAGYQLEKITMGDPNFEHNGETVLAWHFTTDHGEFIMIEEDEEAFMINPETKAVIAMVEFEDEDEDEFASA
ncbi:hypothetical protein AL755_01855 (plasmid) [Arthrobacter sp. ERGS1:01]|uniref:DMP19 family protein n=1 Tax=Arthrobacter sp. ERGS1:01 TaxID=1704044 RepID=UPI0006B43F03|nr:hypothetical protein [Arthrobacter sp. ERGS1:01]ALE04450.1 hypothetical protein AL755_01855 [Arthrobacter sp. ERGS1:01]